MTLSGPRTIGANGNEPAMSGCIVCVCGVINVGVFSVRLDLTVSVAGKSGAKRAAVRIELMHTAAKHTQERRKIGARRKSSAANL